MPFLRAYQCSITMAGFFLVVTAVATLVFPLVPRRLIDGGLSVGDKGAQGVALRTHLVELSAVAAALGLF